MILWPGRESVSRIAQPQNNNPKFGEVRRDQSQLPR